MSTVPNENVCDQFFTGSLRYGQQYTFYDNISNTTPYPLTNIRFRNLVVEQFDYNNSPTFPAFTGTTWFAQQGFIIPPGTLNQRFVETVSKYPILAVPATRSFENLKVFYTIGYLSNGIPEKHIECAKYEITWCGDGVLDTAYGEVCDPNDTTKRGWGTGGCDTACKPITTNTACIPGATVGRQPAALTSTASGLCLPGVTVANFTSAVTGTRTDYTWSCGASAVGGSCAASYDTACPSGSCTPGGDKNFDLRIKKYVK